MIMARREVESEVAGSVWKVEVAEGDTVGVGDVLLIVESMKMDCPIPPRLVAGGNRVERHDTW